MHALPRILSKNAIFRLQIPTFPWKSPRAFQETARKVRDWGEAVQGERSLLKGPVRVVRVEMAASAGIQPLEDGIFGDTEILQSRDPELRGTFIP